MRAQFCVYFTELGQKGYNVSFDFNMTFENHNQFGCICLRLISNILSSNTAHVHFTIGKIVTAMKYVLFSVTKTHN